MSIDRVRYFCVLARVGSVTEAARILRISQPALSKAIKNFEAEAGCRLFVPEGRGLILSDDGRQLLARAESVVAAFEALFAPEPLAARAHTSIVKIGTFEVFSTHLLGSLLAELGADRADGAAFEIRELIPGALERAIAQHVVDYGVTYLPIPHADIRFKKVGSVAMGVYGRAKCFRAETFSDLPFVAPIDPVDGAPTRVNGLDGWPDSRRPRTVKFRVSLMESALEICRQGLAVGYLPRVVVDRHNSKVALQYRLAELQGLVRADEAKQDVFLITRKTASECQITKRIASAIRASLR